MYQLPLKLPSKLLMIYIVVRTYSFTVLEVIITNMIVFITWPPFILSS